MRIVVGVAALAVAACGMGETRSAGQIAADGAAAGVCRSWQAAEAGDERSSQAAFDDEAHGPLHDLADAVENRTVKADLLEAKSRVERGDYSPAAFETLERAIADAAEAADLRRPEPCGGS